MSAPSFMSISGLTEMESEDLAFTPGTWLFRVCEVQALAFFVCGAISLTKGWARASRAFLERDGSGPATARVESPRTTMKKRMVIIEGV